MQEGVPDPCSGGWEFGGGRRFAGFIGNAVNAKKNHHEASCLFCGGTNRHIIASALTRSVRHLWPKPIHDRQPNPLKMVQSLESQSGRIKTPT